MQDRTAQRLRQEARRRDGRYAKMNKCEHCKKAVGSNYYTDGRSDGGVGFVLCRDCNIAGRDMDWETAQRFYRGAA